MARVYFTKSLPQLDLAGWISFCKDAGIDGLDLAVRPKYPVNPDNTGVQLPEWSKGLKDAGLIVGLVTAPTDMIEATDKRALALFEACAKAGVSQIKIGYFPYSGKYDADVSLGRKRLQGFEKLARSTGVKACYHTHSGPMLGCQAVDHGLAHQALPADRARGEELPYRLGAGNQTLDPSAFGQPQDGIVHRFAWRQVDKTLPVGMAPKRALPTELAVDGIGHGEAVVQIGGAVGDLRRQPAPDSARLGLACQARGKARRVAQGKVDTDQQAFPRCAGLGNQRHDGLFGQMAAWVIGCKHACGAGLPDPDRISLGRFFGWRTGRRPIHHGDAVKAGHVGLARRAANAARSCGVLALVKLPLGNVAQVPPCICAKSRSRATAPDLRNVSNAARQAVGQSP